MTVVEEMLLRLSALPSPRPPMVLIVEDDKYDAEISTLQLEQRGCAVAVAGDGESALNFVKCKTPDLVFLDLKLPGMDGGEVWKHLVELFPKLPVIILTGTTNREIPEGEYVCHASKPLDKKQLDRIFGTHGIPSK